MSRFIAWLRGSTAGPPTRKRVEQLDTLAQRIKSAPPVAVSDGTLREIANHLEAIAQEAMTWRTDDDELSDHARAIVFRTLDIFEAMIGGGVAARLPTADGDDIGV